MALGPSPGRWARVAASATDNCRPCTILSSNSFTLCSRESLSAWLWQQTHRDCCGFLANREHLAEGFLGLCQGRFFRLASVAELLQLGFQFIGRSFCIQCFLQILSFRSGRGIQAAAAAVATSVVTTTAIIAATTETHSAESCA